MWSKIYKQMTIIKIPKTLENRLRLFFGLKLKNTREIPKLQVKQWNGRIKASNETIRINSLCD